MNGQKSSGECEKKLKTGLGKSVNYIIFITLPDVLY